MIVGGLGLLIWAYKQAPQKTAVKGLDKSMKQYLQLCQRIVDEGQGDGVENKRTGTRCLT